MIVDELRDRFEEVWLWDTEFRQPAGEREPDVVCLVAIEFFSNRKLRIWKGEFPADPPFRIDERVLHVAFFASAEIESSRVLGWPDPVNLLDLYVEHIWIKNNLPVPEHLRRRTLLTALQLFGCKHIEAEEKHELRELVLRGEPYTGSERMAILDYCESDVVALRDLLPAMLPYVENLDQALHRGDYVKTVASMQRCGIPMDVSTFNVIRENRDQIRQSLISAVSDEFPVFEDGSFKIALFGDYLNRQKLLDSWPRTITNLPCTDSSTMRDMARVHPFLETLKEVLSTDRLLKANKLAVGSDGRNRSLLGPFGTRTGRNAPSNSELIFGPACWLRGLIQPGPGRAIAYVDWEQQEIGIAAALSQDAHLLHAYQSGDPYLQFAKLAKAVPDSATKKSHGEVRELFKKCMLAVNYGMGEHSLARNIGGSIAKARHLLLLHRGMFRRFWRWSDHAVHACLLEGFIHTRFGWRMYKGEDPNVRSIANYPCQGNGAEMMRMASILLHERGLPICCPVHDAFLVEAPADEIEHVVAETQQAMGDASEIVLDGFRLNSDAKTIHHPERYMDPRGVPVWEMVTQMLSQDVAGQAVNRMSTVHHPK